MEWNPAFWKRNSRFKTWAWISVFEVRADCGHRQWLFLIGYRQKSAGAPHAQRLLVNAARRLLIHPEMHLTLVIDQSYGVICWLLVIIGVPTFQFDKLDVFLHVVSRVFSSAAKHRHVSGLLPVACLIAHFACCNFKSFLCDGFVFNN